jgi:putative endonuclease
VWEHKQALTSGFTARYGLNRLVYCESTDDVHAALAREKQLKGWLRRRKVALIESVNPQWEDLSAGWFEAEETDPSLRSG